MDTNWHTSSYSGKQGNCVQVKADDTGGVAVRHSSVPDDAILHFTADEWEAFVKGVKAGEFDFW